MAEVEGSTPEELEQQATLIEEAVAAALALIAAQAAAAVLGAVPGFVGTAVVAAPWVSLDDVATVPTMWLTQVDGTVVPLLRGILDEQAADVREQIQTVVDAQPGIYGVPSLIDGEPPVVPTVPDIPNVTSDQLMAQARNRLVGIGDLLWVDIRAQLTEGIAAGETVEQLAKRVEATAGVAEPRARTIARTETISVSNGSSIAQARSAGFPMRKTWLATEDLRTRTWHTEADNQTVGLDDLFEVGPDFLDYPGDPTGSPGNVINCRCGIGFTLLGLPAPVVAAVGRKTAADPYVRDSDGQFAKTGTPDFAKMKVTDLRAELKQRGIKGLSKANKAQLVEALNRFDEATGDAGSGAGRQAVDALPRSHRKPSVSSAAKATNPSFGSTFDGPTYSAQGKAGGRWTPALGPLPGGAFEENCTNTVNAFEMRMRGYDVTAAPLDVLSKYGYAAGRTYAETDQLFADAWTLPNGRPHGRSFASQKWRSFAEMDAEIVRDWPEGGRGVITVGRHIFNVTKVNGQARYVEAQYDATPTRNVTTLYKRKFRGYKSSLSGEVQEGKLIRLDDLVPDEGIMQTVEAAK